ncbi:hypothetical protein PaG_01970 [Moesziomyces aphidis]|nr:hypothetical protein PaG_01970 [Moesziomyces aphidis]
MFDTTSPNHLNHLNGETLPLPSQVSISEMVGGLAMPAFGLQISGAAVRVALASGVGLAFSLLVDGAPRAVFGVGFGREEGALEPRHTEKFSLDSATPDVQGCAAVGLWIVSGSTLQHKTLFQARLGACQACFGVMRSELPSTAMQVGTLDGRPKGTRREFGGAAAPRTAPNRTTNSGICDPPTCLRPLYTTLLHTTILYTTSQRPNGLSFRLICFFAHILVDIHPLHMSAFQSTPQRTPYNVLNQTFLIDNAYEITKDLGQGAYGCVAAATHRGTGESVAIKKITNVFTKKILTKRALREIKLLRHFRGHKNITCLYDMDIIDPVGFNEVYLYEELMEADLHAIIRSGQPLSDAHFQSFIYQTLCGLKYIHSASVLHRDLKPGNLLVNADCELKICDFGLARGFETDPELAKQAGAGGFMTEYVATRWYRAPEIMLSFQNYTTAIDIWSVGCILAELLGGRPIFKGRDYVDQLNQILHYLGTPSEETLRRVGSPRAQDYIRSLPYQPRIPFQRLYPQANPLALDLLERMLEFDPAKRISCEEALQHPYLAVWHDPADEPVCPRKFDFGFEAVDEVEGMKTLILDEVRSFRTEVRRQARMMQQPKRQESLPIPTREDIQRSSPTDADNPGYALLGASTGIIHGASNSEHASGMLDNACVMEDPAESFERELTQAR